MKPGDHPDFFRLPPPPGRSRESKIVLDERGRFWNGSYPIEHAAMTRAFASWIRRHPDDGRFILTNGYDWTYFTVKDAPYFVRGVHGDEHGGVALELFDGTVEPLDPTGVSVSADGVLYAAVKGGAFSARFSAAAQAQIVDYIDEDSDGAPCLRISGTPYRISERSTDNPGS
jgi:uncharacterized protein